MIRTESDIDAACRMLTISDKIELMKDAKLRLKAIDDVSRRICEGQAGYVDRLFRHLDRTDEEKKKLEERIAKLQKELDGIVDSL